ncbi:MAG: ABC transporter substrate-binding protein [Candidatus Saccharimonadales bacterium]
MIDHSTKLRWRRKFRRRQRQIEDIGSSTEENLDRHFFRRLGRLYEVRRFLAAWILLVVAMIGAVVVQTRALGDYYLQTVPVAGGIYSEGILGSYTNANPIYASSEVDASVSRLLFAGLLTYDKQNNLTGDLAESWSVDGTGKRYTVTLRDKLKWHDNKPLTANDVVFTFQTVQNPDARSPFFSSWQGIKVSAKDNRTVIFELPSILASFPYALTSGIIPEHVLRNVEPGELRGSLFNTVEPVGAGPFKWKDVQVYGDTAADREQRIALSAFDDYHRGRPRLSEFIVRAYLEESSLIASFNEGELNGVAGALSMPLTGGNSKEHPMSLTGAVMVFLRNDQPYLQDAKVRRALAQATNQQEVIRQLSDEDAKVDGPLLPEHTGYNPGVTQYPYNPDQARAQLEEAGWKVNASTGIRTKDGKPFTIELNTLSSAEYAAVANLLQKQWREVGVDLSVSSLAQRDLQTAIDDRSYDALVYGIVMGQDPDQFAYWHSSQADVRSQRRLNFSNYSSKAVDSALEAGRTRIDPGLRAAKYLPFLQNWREDAPAIALYRPKFVYTSYGSLYNFDQKAINSPIDRYNFVETWMIRTERAIQ